MIDQLRSELLKMRTTRTAAVLLGVAAALTLLGVVVEGLVRTLGKLAEENEQRTLFGAETNAVVFATFVGLLAVTTEFRYGTIRPTLLFQPRRRLVLAAKLAAAALAGTVFAAVCASVSFGSGLAILGARDVDLALTGADALVLGLGTVAASALSAMVGVAVGALIRNQVGAIITLAAYAFGVDTATLAALPAVGRFLPGQAGNALAGMPTEHLLAPGLGGAVLLAWTVALVAMATVRNDRSDV